MHYVYFLKSAKNKKYYVGCTSKYPNIRLEEHNQGSNVWTRQNGPFLLVYYESYNCKSCARQRETFYKSGFGKEIRNAIIRTVSAKD